VSHSWVLFGLGVSPRAARVVCRMPTVSIQAPTRCSLFIPSTGIPTPVLSRFPSSKCRGSVPNQPRPHGWKNMKIYRREDRL